MASESSQILLPTTIIIIPFYAHIGNVLKYIMSRKLLIFMKFFQKLKKKELVLCYFYQGQPYQHQQNKIQIWICRTFWSLSTISTAQHVDNVLQHEPFTICLEKQKERGNLTPAFFSSVKGPLEGSQWSKQESICKNMDIII